MLEWRLNDRNVPETVSWATPGDRPDTLHSSRRIREPSVRQELIGYVGFAAIISTAPTAAVGGREALSSPITSPQSRPTS
jgi:hypothetical protein